MNKLIILTKALLKETSIFDFYDMQSRRKSIIRLFTVLALLTFFIVFIYNIVSTTLDVLNSIGQKEILLGMGLSISCIFMFTYGLFFTTSVFFYSKDIEYLLPFPISALKIIVSKFFVVLLYGYLTESIIAIPLISVFGLKESSGVIFWLYSILIMLVLPIVPIVASCIIVFCIMRFSPLAKNKDLFKITGGLMAIALGFGIQIAIRAIIEYNPQILMKFFNENYNIIKIMNPTADFAAKSLIYADNFQGIINILLFIGLSMIVILLFGFIGNRLYFKSIIGFTESFSKSVQISQNAYGGKLNKKHKIFTLISREFKTLIRTPDYLINCIVPNLLYPLMIPVIFFTNIISELVVYLKLNIYTEYFVLFGFCVVLFQSGSNSTAATSISRDGKDIFVLKYMPIKYKTYLHTKLATSMITGSITLLIVLIIFFIFDIPLATLGLFMIPSVMAIVFSSQLGVILDLYSPKVNWDNEWQAVRKNINPIICTMVCSLLAGLTGYVLFNIHLSANNYCILLTTVFGFLNIILYNVICLSENKIIELIE